MSTVLAQGVSSGQAAPLGLLVLVLLGIALWLLVRNMDKHLRRLPRTFPPPDGPPPGTRSPGDVPPQR